MAITRLTPGGYPGAALATGETLNFTSSVSSATATPDTVAVAVTMDFTASITAATATTSAVWLRTEQNPGKDNAIAWWSLDEVSGTRADSQGSNDLTDHNTVGNTTGKQSNAADFESDNSEALYIADNADLSFGDEDFSISGWVKLESLALDAVWSKYVTSGNHREYMLYINSSKFQWLVSSDGTSSTSVVADSEGTLSTGTWYFVTVYHDATANEIGVSVNGGTIDTASHTTGVNDDTSEFNLGAWEDHTTNFLDGALDEVVVWNKVLSQDEIDWLYNLGSGRAFSDLCIEFTSSTTAATATPDDVNLATDLLLTSSTTAATATPDDVMLSKSIRDQLSIVSSTATTDVAVLGVALDFVSNLAAAATATPDDAVFGVAFDFTASIASATATPDTAEILAIIDLTVAVSSATATPDTVTLAIARNFTASIASATVTPDTAALALTADFTVAISSATVTPDTAVLGVAFDFASTATIATVTPDDAEIAIVLLFVSASLSATVTPDDVALAILRGIAPSIASATATPDDAAIVLAANYTSSISVASSTDDAVSIAIARDFSSSLTAASVTTDVAVLNIGSIVTGIIIASFTSRKPGQAFTSRKPGMTFTGTGDT